MGICCASREINTGLELNVSQVKLGKQFTYDRIGSTETCVQALEIAQKKRDEPVYVSEIHEEVMKLSYLPASINLNGLTKNTLYNLYADDKILGNRELTMFSLRASD